MDERHRRRRRQHYTVELTEIGEVDVEQTQGGAVLTIPGRLQTEVRGQLLDRLPRHGQAACQRIVVAQIHTIGTLDVTILIERGHRQTCRQGVADRYVHRGFGIQQIVGAACNRRRAFELTTRFGLRRGNRDCTTDGIASEQRTLRASQHFEPLDVDDVEHRTDRAGNVNTVDIQTNARLRRRQKLFLTDAAQIDRRGVGCASETGIVLERHARHEVRDFIETGDTAIIEGVTGVRRNGDRRILQTFLAHPRGDDDLLQNLLRAVRGLRKRSARNQAADDDYRADRPGHGMTVQQLMHSNHSPR